MQQSHEPQDRPRRRWIRRTVAGVSALTGLLVAAVLFIAYAWQPSAAVYQSRYMARIQSRYADTPIARFHYTKTGHGSPVILVAGGGEWLYSYRDTIPALASRHTVYAVDLPGQGYTTLKQHNFSYDLDAMSAALGSFMDAIGLRKAAIVGHSWGGAWSLYFAERHPGRADRLVLVDATGLDVPASWDWRPLGFPVVGELIGKLMTENQAATFLRKAFAHQGHVTPRVIDEDWAPMSRPQNRQALWMSQRNLDCSVTQKLMGHINVPTLILWGSKDQWDKPSEAVSMAHRIPGARAVLLPGCGHNLPEDCPAQANPLIADFLRN
jgi:pimeloyl-ACP methyl ester carboxylesterase